MIRATLISAIVALCIASSMAMSPHVNRMVRVSAAAHNAKTEHARPKKTFADLFAERDHKASPVQALRIAAAFKAGRVPRSVRKADIDHALSLLKAVGLDNAKTRAIHATRQDRFKRVGRFGRRHHRDIDASKIQYLAALARNADEKEF